MADDELKGRGGGKQVEQEATPVCPHCLDPFPAVPKGNHPDDYYCKNCGTAVGQLAPYIPYVNINFNYGIPLGKLWHRVWRDKGVSVRGKVVYFCLIVLWFPAMLLIGLPFILWEKLGQKERQTE